MTTTPAGRPDMGTTLEAHTLSAAAVGFPETARRGARTGFAAVGAMLAAGALACTSATAATPPTMTATFSSNGAEQTFKVPTGVSSIRVNAIGEAGESAFRNIGGVDGTGGAGADVVGQLPVSAGETLYVEVAAPGFNGGGYGGDAFIEGGFGGNGGGASDVRTVPAAEPDSLESRLLVAAGGGGGGGVTQDGVGGSGGNAGNPGTNGTGGQSAANGAGGGAGTLTGGGAGGTGCSQPEPYGADGGSGTGGRGGEGFTAPWSSSGGGGGGGYTGGGGGEGTCGIAPPDEEGGAGGGGGGSSFVSGEASFSSFGAASTSTVPSVSITYLTPASATPGTSVVTFSATQPLQTVSAPQTITITNTGGNPLQISGVAFAGSGSPLPTDAPEDFLIGSSTCFGSIAYEESCQVTVRFAPQNEGAQTGTLQILGNMGAGATVVTLTGTGGALPQGATGSQGSQGAAGSQGPQGQTGVSGPEGSAGKTGASGAQGPAGEIGKPGAAGSQGTQGLAGPKGEQGPRGSTATYVCHPRRRHGSYEEACFVSLRSASKSAVSARLEHDGVTYATWTASRLASAGGLSLKATRRVPAGRYTLVLASKHGTSTETVTVG